MASKVPSGQPFFGGWGIIPLSIEFSVDINEIEVVHRILFILIFKENTTITKISR